MDVNLVDTLPPNRLVTKLRPFVHAFLSQAIEFDLAIYTLGNQDYALRMVKLLDEGNEQMFYGRVISCGDSTIDLMKSLDIVLCKDSTVVNLDDRKEVWLNDYQDNMIVMPPYNFFRSTSQQQNKSLSELKVDEDEQFGRAHLSKTLRLLKSIHIEFFCGKGQEIMERDVR
ncbi:hypothetical protein ACLB2K_013132 [Fragaria x ananassa]